MKIIGIGVDIIQIERIKKIKDLERLSRFFFLKKEMSDLKKHNDKYKFIASRVALKEAIIKAYPSKLTYHDFYLTKKNQKIQVKFKKKNIKFNVFTSISHEFKYAIGYAIISQKKWRF